MFQTDSQPGVCPSYSLKMYFAKSQPKRSSTKHSYKKEIAQGLKTKE